ncbi:methyltransferase domain-containing protein [Sphingobacterium sp. DK4209]|uniref:Methyltransferase domain-containing protein n=1 Tax=Sphingobacterium zhuxiongii TaxID=2662364 RepID=A0A5Q0Q8Z6_9SPHI|nr:MULTISPECIES: class I SAM-dependent methyltransferase [unclassified Sphingobacterium]MVZ66127.1 methyltransferase domain-containing protein [Sphingobacterium sp. DK4209]QGA26547.1 methyltransferase domain-containing protein [Sphingobacterium sp. dk4302]
MEIKRSRFQGVSNILRFNWHFYVLAILLFIVVLMILPYFSEDLQRIAFLGLGLASFSILSSLLISYYIYDYSDLYQLNWIQNLAATKILNVNAGFDETSELLRRKFPDAVVYAADFYDPKKHTEVSIKRARKRYPAPADTISVNSSDLPFKTETFDLICCIFAAHEIRDPQERVLFLKELACTLTTDGSIMITEHLRDLNNFLAFQIGFFHFYSDGCWRRIFKEAGLRIVAHRKINPFIISYSLKK